MTDLTEFESRLEGRLLGRAAIASRPFDAAEIARSVVDADRNARRKPLPVGRLSSGAARWWPIAALLLLAGVVAAVAVGAFRRESPLPTGVVTNGLVAAAANPWDFGSGYNADIYLLRDGQPEPLRPTIGAAGDGLAQQCPAFSPDGRFLAYGQARGSGPGASLDHVGWDVSDRAIVVVEIAPDGTASAPRLTLPIASRGSMVCPAWSPDGNRLAFRVDDGLWIVGRDGGAARRWPISAITGDAENELAWSRDGARIAVSEQGRIRIVDVADGTDGILQLSGAAPGSLGWTAGDKGLIAVGRFRAGELGDAVYQLDAVTGGSRRLTPMSTEAGVSYWFEQASLSPDGNRVAYLQNSSRCTAPGCGPGPQLAPIAVTRLDNAETVGLEYGVGSLVSADGSPYFASHLGWSPDGSRLLLSSIDGIVAIDPSGAGRATVYASGVLNRGLNLEWSPSEVSWQPLPN
jgi:Tol biopolymer transport system component